MTLTHYTKPKIKVAVDPLGNDDEVQTSTTQTQLTLTENGIDLAELWLADEGRTLFNNTIVYGDVAAIYLHYDDDPAVTPGTFATTDLRFYGFVEDMTPILSGNNEMLYVRLRSYSRCLLDMVVNQEYGSESTNSTLDELHEILQDAANGIIDNYVNEILNSGVGSGYSLSDTYIQEDADALKYAYFPLKPAKNSIDDLLDVFQALQTHVAAGWHWICRTIESPADTFSHYFLLGQVGTHTAGPPDVASLWPNYWNTNQANSTIVVKEDMLTSAFEWRRPRANHVLYYGRLRKPGDGDRWTEFNNALWGTGDHTTVSDENGANLFVIGDYSLKMAHVADATPDNEAFYPAAVNAGWNIENWGGKYNIPTVDFWFMSDQAGEAIGSNWNLQLYCDGTANWFTRQFGLETTEADKWYHLVYPIGPNAPIEDYATRQGVAWAQSGAGDWDNVDGINFQLSSAAGDNVNWWIDGLGFSGHVLRSARKTGETYYKQLVITDEVGKDDSGLAADDGYVMAQLAYAELLRSARRPIQGTIALPGKPTILAGQKAHIHSAKHSGGYRINKDMRITQIRLIFSSAGLVSYLDLTDDLTNSRPMPMDTQYNLMLAAANPDYQSRQVSSIKAREIDVTQAVLEKTYAFNDFY